MYGFDHAEIGAMATIAKDEQLAVMALFRSRDRLFGVGQWRRVVQTSSEEYENRTDKQGSFFHDGTPYGSVDSLWQLLNNHTTDR